MILTKELKYKAFYIVAKNKNNQEYYFTVNKHKELVLDEKNRDIFIVTDGLSISIVSKRLCGLFSIVGQGEFLFKGDQSVVSSRFVNTNEYKNNTTFCLDYNREEDFSISDSKGNPLLFSKKNKSFISDSRVYSYSKKEKNHI